jgi:hypothetical protein
MAATDMLWNDPTLVCLSPGAEVVQTLFNNIMAKQEQKQGVMLHPNRDTE